MAAEISITSDKRISKEELTKFSEEFIRDCDDTIRIVEHLTNSLEKHNTISELIKMTEGLKERIAPFNSNALTHEQDVVTLLLQSVIPLGNKEPSKKTEHLQNLKTIKDLIRKTNNAYEKLVSSIALVIGRLSENPSREEQLEKDVQREVDAQPYFTGNLGGKTKRKIKRKTKRKSKKGGRR